MFDQPTGTVTAVLGPTNTGKTHYAVERMLSRESGIIGLPLRLLAREVYDRIVSLRGPQAVSLITGEEKISPPRARYHVCTVEAMPLGAPVDFVAIDEIQLCTDPDRGHVFTDRLLHARGRYETLFLGSDTMRSRIASLVPGVHFHARTRFSNLAWTGSKKLSRLKPRTAIVAFSVDQVYAIAELIRRQRGGAAVVMGALSPRTRNAQVALYQEGDVDYMVATDAIGMGLNMDVDHVAFAGTAKFDGWRHRPLEPNELAQIAGRAGRYTRDGTFGTTGDAPLLAPETVEAIEEHRFRPAGKLMWRNTDLRFHTVEALLASLDEPANDSDLMRAREAEDQAVLRALWEEPGIREIANRGDRVRLLWQTCQIPDFRKVSPGEHATLVGRIYRFLLTDAHCIPSDWLAGQIGRLDRVHGDIDALSKRLAFIRTWTYVANRPGWVEDPEHWRGETRAVEDRLSDALHERLTQRFVDRRTSHLMRRLKQKERLVAEVNDKGEVTAEGHFLGRLTGFRFAIDETASGDELKTLRSASLSAVGAELSRRADKLYLSPDTEIDLTDQGGFMWGSDAVGRLSKGDDPLAPRITVFVDDMADPQVSEKVERRLRHWLGRRVNAQFEPMLAMRDDEAITGLARGVAFRLAENFGIMPRRDIADDLKALEQADRALLRKHGVRFGQHFVFMPALLKPAPTRLRLLLWSLAQDLDDFPDAPPPGHVTVTLDPSAPDGYYHMAGYRPAGARALRIDMMERLADLIRPMDARAGFEASQDMLSITGLGHEHFAELMTGLGYEVETGERARQARPPKDERKARGRAGSQPAAQPVAPTGQPSEEPTPEAAAVLAEGAAMTETPTEISTETSTETLTETSAETQTDEQAAAPDVDAAEPGDVAPDADAAAARAAEGDGAAEGLTALPEADAQAAESAGREQSVEALRSPDGPAGAAPIPGDEAAVDPEAAGTIVAPDADDAGAAEAVPAEASSDSVPAAAGGGDPETAGQGASADEAAPADEATPAGEGERETYYTFRIRARGRSPRRGPQRQAGEAGPREGQPRRARRGKPSETQPAAAGGETGGEAGGEAGAAEGGKPARRAGGGGKRPERGDRPERQGGKGGGEGDRPRGKGKGPKRDRQDKAEPRRFEAKPPRNEKPLDPDSPFAILQQLKNR